jgi:pimeloyl-ACP methyl ester carboxylesterase
LPVKPDLRVPVSGGSLVGTIDRGPHGEEAPLVLLLHGGPGMSVDSLAGVERELLQYARVATFQQRGLAPSTTEGPYDIPTAVEDVRAVLRELGEPGVVLAGHSWGAHLALAVVARGRLPDDQLSAVMCMDIVPGVTGDGGLPEFQTAVGARAPAAALPRLAELAGRRAAGGLAAGEFEEMYGLLWPAYFADPSTAPHMPPIRLDPGVYGQLLAAARDHLPFLEASLADVTLPVLLARGARSPVPSTVTSGTAERLPDAVVEEVAGAGHFFWLERPGTAGRALGRLLERCPPQT